MIYEEDLDTEKIKEGLCEVVRGTIKSMEASLKCLPDDNSEESISYTKKYYKRAMGLLSKTDIDRNVLLEFQKNYMKLYRRQKNLT